MAEFDPKAYLVSGSKPSGFDPKAYLYGTMDTSRKVVQEMHPDITFLQRAAVKNLGTDPQQSINFLRQKNPGMEFDLEGNQIIARKPGEAEWRVLDPSGFDIQDISDVGYDIAAGGLTGAATVAGGLAGGLPGAVGAGAASSGALETLRQGIGKWADVNQEFEPMSIGIATAAGGVAPALLGSGATTAQIAKAAMKEAASKEITEQAATAALKESQRGLLSRAAPNVWEGLSGVPARTYAAMRERIPKILEARKIGEGEARAQFASAAKEKLTTVLNAHRDDLQNRFGEALDAAGESIDLDKVKAPIQARIADLEEKWATRGTAATKDEIATLRKYLDDITPRMDEVIETVDADGNLVEETIRVPVSKLSARDATEYLRDIRAKLESAGVLDEATGKFSLQRVSEADKLAADTMMKTYRSVSQQLDDAVSRASPEIRKEYAEFKGIERSWLPNLKTEAKTEKFLRNLNKKEHAVLSSITKKQAGKLGLDIQNELDDIAAMGMYIDPSIAPLSSKGATSTSRTMAFAPVLGSAGYSLAESMGSKNPFIWSGLTTGLTNIGLSPAAQFLYARTGQGIRRGAEKVLEKGSKIPGVGKVIGSQGLVSPWQYFAQPKRSGE